MKVSELIYFTCDKGHTNLRNKQSVKSGRECPDCKRIRLSIASKPKIMKFFDKDKNKGLDPEHLYEYMSTVIDWKCPNCGYEWRSQLRSGGKRLCPCCESGTAIQKDYNDVFTVVPELRKDFIEKNNPGIDIGTIGVGDKKNKIYWTCHKCGYEWASSVFSRTRGHNNQNKINNCPVCGKAKRGKKFSEEYPELAKKWDFQGNGFEFDQLTGNDYSKTFKWICKIHGSYEQSLSAAIRSLKTNNGGCNYCLNRKAKDGDLFSAKYPFLFDELAIPETLLTIGQLDFGENISKNAWWNCEKCGSKYAMTPLSRAMYHKRNIVPCPMCKDRKNMYKYQGR